MAKSCTWCNKYIGDNEQYWFKNVPIDGKVYQSKEVFCSNKCSYEYPYSPTADKPNEGNIGCLVILIIVGAIIYFATSNSSQSNQSTSEPVQSENIVADTSQLNSSAAPSKEDRNLDFTNNTSETIYLALAYYNNSSWESHGYYSIEPNSNRNISLPESFNDESVYWYAIDAVNNEWAGSDKNFCIHPEKFDFYGNDSENCQDGSKGFYKLGLSGTTTSMSLSR